MKRLLLLSVLSGLLSVLGTTCYSQQATTISSAPVAKKEAVGLKPADGTPASFSTKEELDKTVPQKLSMLKEMIDSGKYSGERLRVLREEYWRFENAIVAPK